jgi:hypothetical protein
MRKAGALAHQVNVNGVLLKGAIAAVSTVNPRSTFIVIALFLETQTKRNVPIGTGM